MSQIEDKKIFDDKYNEWKKKNKNTTAFGNDHRSRIFSLDKIIQLEEKNNQKFPYSIISDKRAIWNEKSIFSNHNKTNFEYIIFMSVDCNYLIQEPNPSRPDYDRIKSNPDEYYLRPNYTKILEWWIENETRIETDKRKYPKPSDYLLSRCDDPEIQKKIDKIYDNAKNHAGSLSKTKLNTNLDDLIKKIRINHCPEHRIEYRLKKEKMAKEILTRKSFDELTNEDWAEFFQLINMDLVEGKELKTRFGLSFRGNNKTKLLENIEKLNACAKDLWNCDKNEIDSLLDRWWQEPIPGAGAGFQTIILYLRTDVEFNIWLPKMVEGIQHFTGERLPQHRISQNYMAYNNLVNEFKDDHRLTPQEMDIILTVYEDEKNINSDSLLSSEISLNQILYGPPGTGKTYNTVNEALKICGIDSDGLDRNEIKERFDELVDAGQIVFTTFHQSMTYEDFIEGIKPNIASEEESVTYKINEGIFYRLAIEASFSIVEKSQSHSAKDVLDFSSAYDSYIENVSDRLDKSEDVDLKTKSGGTIYIDSISDHGNISIKHSGKEKTYVVSKTRLTKLNSAIGDLEGVTNINDTIRSIIGGCNSSAYWAVLNEIRKEKPKQDNHNQRPEKISFNDKKEAVKSFLKQDYQGITGRPYVLIIDEINRGNISEIFGELITLIEEDKRLGREEAIEVTLPYSKEKFGVPSNLFIIGTMNTADRSIEALDTALRRRFSFIEMLPDCDLIKTEGKLKDSDGKIDELDLPEVLNTINLRIEKLLDHDHAIGHSYFLSVESLDDLKKVFHNKIIPLLQEYFFGDTGKIGLVIGKGFFEDKGEQPKFDQNFFADFDDYDTDALMDKKVYHLINVDKLSDDTFVEALYCLLNKKISAS